MKASLVIKLFLMLLSINSFVGCGPDPTFGTDGEFFNPPTNIEDDGNDGNVTELEDIRLYATMTDHTGNLNGRSGADDICETALHPTLAELGYSVRAFISFSANDEILDMPTLYGIPTDLPVLNVSGMPVATDWNNLLSGGLVQSLRDAGVMGANDYFWSGSNSNGSMAAVTCSGFTNGTNGVFGATGYSQATDSTWAWTQSTTCNTGRKILCIAF